MIRQLRFELVCGALLLITNGACAANAPASAAIDKPKPADDSAAGLIAAPRGAAVETIVDSNPTTPAQLLKAALLLADLDRLDLAKKYLAQLAASKPDENTLAESAGQIDPEMLLRVSAHPDLQPEGAQYASAILAAAGKLVRDPAWMMQQIDRLADPSRHERHEAIVRIMSAHEDAVPALIKGVADPSKAASHETVREILVRIGPPTVAPLVAALRSDDAALKLQVIDVVKRIGSSEAVAYLVAPVVAENSSKEVRDAAMRALGEIAGAKRASRSDAIQLLVKEIQRDLKHDRPITVGADGRVTVWRWDAASEMPVREELPEQQAWAALAGRLAEDLLDIAPDDATAQRLYLVSKLEAAALASGLDHAVSAKGNAELERGVKLGTAALEDALTYAIATDRMPAATAAATLLGESGDASLWVARDGQIRPLVQALSLGDRRLRFAAAEAIMKLKPMNGFAGSSELVSSLVFLADSPGVKRALIAHPNAITASQFAALVAGLGYEVETAGNGRQAYLEATSSGDYELILLSGRLDKVPVWVLVQQLRRDPRTAAVPIALMAEDETVEPERLKSMVEGDPLTGVFLRPIEEKGLKFHVDKLLERADGELVPSDVRQRQALAALGWLKQLNEASAKDFDLRSYEPALTRALARPQTSAAAAELLARIGSHTAQKSLTELANTSTQPIALREAAAAAFSRATRQYGIQLTTTEIRHQYDRFNQSSSEGKEAQQVLGLVLDAIEAPTKK